MRRSPAGSSADRVPNVFYERFERHAHGEGLKARTTHYCPGCGHGLVHKYLAEAIATLGVQDRTVAVSPVGCAVFLYYYLDVGNTQAAHGRAPAVALGHKLAHPGSIVVSYQGDGDLASIGLAEIIQVAQLGVPITVVFVNNAVYGMTGGQMAPTTLLGQRTATTPDGRPRAMGRPLRMAELIAELDGPVYVERVALYDARRRIAAAAAIERALRLQVEERGFAFVEVLAECPTHWRLTPRESERWVRDEMLPVFPLGIKKEVSDPAPWRWSAPGFDPQALLDALPLRRETVEPERRSPFPRAPFGPDVALKLAGAGGDGAQTAAMLIAEAAVDEGFDATHIPSYGPESRGGTSHADVRLAESAVLSPAAPRPHVLVAFNAPSLQKFAPAVVAGGLILYDSSTASLPTPPDGSVRAVGIPFAQIASQLGAVKVKNAVALGAFAALTGLLRPGSLRAALRRTLRSSAELLALNEAAFDWGVRAGEDAGRVTR